MSIRYNYVSALAAAGKTYEAIRDAVARVRGGERTIFAALSTALVEQIAADARALGCTRVTAFHSDDGHAQPVTSRLTAHFKEADFGQGEIVVMTTAALERLTFINRRKDWHLIVDEIPTPLYHRRFTLNEHRDILLSLFDECPWNAAYSLLMASEDDTGRVMDRAGNVFKDEITAHVQDLANKLLSRHWRVYAGNDQLAVMRQADDRERSLDVFGLLAPSIFDGFRSCTIMGACFEDSLLYRCWLREGVVFTPHPRIKPRFTQYPNSALVAIRYVVERDWSARLRDTEVDGKRVIEHVADRMLGALGGASYVYLLNKAEDDLKMSGGLALPHVSHGLNSFSGFHNAVLLSALNPPPAYFGFVRDMAHIDPDEVRTAIYRAGCYQAALRISIRDLDNTDPKQIMVADRATAEWLGQLIGTARVERLAGPEIVPPDRRRVARPKTNAEMVQKYRDGKKAELVRGLDEVNQLGNRTSFIYKEPLSPQLYHVGDLFRDKYSRLAALDTVGMSVLTFKDFLAESWRGQVTAKENRPLICPCHFDPDKVEHTSRGGENIVSISGIWLDNDGGDLKAEDFASWFRNPLVVFNSFNATVEAPRWRVWIPTSHLITPEVHRHILAQIKKMLIKHGYYGKTYIAKQPEKKVRYHGLIEGEAQPLPEHGFDEPKFTQAVLFYLPAQADAGPEASFWIEKHWDQPLLNPYQWVDRSIVDERPPTIPMMQPVAATSKPAQTDQADDCPVKQARIERALEVWRNHATGTGNQAHFKLAVSLWGAGMNWAEASSLLTTEVWAHSHSRNSAQERIVDMRNYPAKIWNRSPES